MKKCYRTLVPSGSRIAAILLVLLGASSAFAYPPAPPHTIYGMLRDEFGGAVTFTEARVVLETDSGLRIETGVIPGLASGVNFELLIPMDSGIAPDMYRPDALQPLVPFRLKVIIGSQTYLPIEMSGDMVSLGEPAESTRLDLTLGLDSDNDGLPDSWKDMVIAMMGGGLTYADIRPGDDIDGDGFSNLDEYIAGTYAWDGADFLALDIKESSPTLAVLEFLAINGRTYSIEGSDGSNGWTEVPFSLPELSTGSEEMTTFLAPDVRILRVETIRAPDTTTLYRLRVR